MLSMVHRAARKISRSARSLSPPLWTEAAIALRNRSFEPEYWLVPRLARGGVAVDVGANDGLYTYYMAKSAKRVHAFEPNPLCLKELKRLAPSNATVHDCGLSDTDGSAELRFDPRKTGYGSIDPANRLDLDGLHASERVAIPIRTLDSFALTGVSLIKIDVEGHEAAVVRGAVATITASRPALIIESELRHNPQGFTGLCETLYPLGYSSGYLHGDRIAPVAPDDLGRLQSNSGYVNNFLFLPPERVLSV